MLEARIDLIPSGDENYTRGLVTIAIWNDVTTSRATGGQAGSYHWLISHQHDSVWGRRAARSTGIDTPTARQLIDDPDGPWVWKRGRVENFARRRGATALLAAVLRQARV